MILTNSTEGDPSHISMNGEIQNNAYTDEDHQKVSEIPYLIEDVDTALVRSLANETALASISNSYVPVELPSY